MVKPLIDFLVTKAGTYTVIVITALIHLISNYFVSANAFFGYLWFAIGTRLYIQYIGLDLTQSVLEWFDQQTERVAETVTKNVTQGAAKIAQSLQDAGASLATGTSLQGMMSEFNKHKIGLGLCAKSLTEAETSVQVIAEAGKISSMLGLEVSIVNRAIGTLTSNLGNAMQPLQENGGLEDIEKMIPLIASSAAFADIEINDVNLSKHMDKVARNIKSAEVITAHVRQVAESAGIIKPQNFEVLQELSQMVLDLQEEHRWIAQTLAVCGADFCKTANYGRVQRYQTQVKALAAKLRSINTSAIKNNQIAVQANFILTKCNDYLDQIEIIRKSNGIRPVPVGVNIWGASQLGKSTLVNELVKRVKTKLKQRADLFGDTESWTQWDANQREEFDSGYVGQEIVNMDDAFQDKSHKDHLMWYTYISPTCVGTIQGQVNQKGLPFRALLCITTSNHLPRSSTTVNHIPALYERFPLTFKVSRKTKSAVNYDCNFSHLEIEKGAMVDFINGYNKKGDPIRNFEKSSLDDMVNMICDRMVTNMNFYNQKVTIPIVAPIEEHGQSVIDEAEEFIFDDDTMEYDSDEIFGENNVEPHNRQPPMDDEGVEEDQFIRLPAVTHQGTANAQQNWYDISEMIARDLQRAMRGDVHTIEDVGPWADKLHRVEKDFNNKIKLTPFCRQQYRQEAGLYEFLHTLGSYQVLDADKNEFDEQLLEQCVLKCSDPYGTEYLWSPYFHQGKVLYLVSPNLERDLDRRFLSFWHRQKERLGDAFRYWFQTEQGLRAFARHTVYIAGTSPAIAANLPIAVTASMMLRYTSRALQPHVRPYWVTGQGFRGGIYNVINSPLIGWQVVDNCFRYFEEIARRLAHGMMGYVLRFLEYLGVNVEGYWRDLANITTALVAETALIVIGGLLLYLFYRLIKSLTTKPTLSEHESKNEFGKGRRMLKQTKKLAVRAFQPRSHEELQCEKECCEEEIQQGDWMKIGKCQSNNTIYDVDFLSHIIDQTKDLKESTMSEIIRNERTHTSIRMNECDDFLVQESKFDSAKRIPYTDLDGDVYVAEFIIHLLGTEDEVLQMYKKYIQVYQFLNISNWEGEIHCREVDNKFHIRMKLVGLRTTIQGVPRKFTKNSLRSLSAKLESFLGVKQLTEDKIEDILEAEDKDFKEMGADEAFATLDSLRRKHQVFMSRVDIDNFDTDRTGKSTHGIGHLDQVIFNAHNYVPGDYVRFWRYQERPTMSHYQVCVVEKTDVVRDLGFARIVSKDAVREYLRKKGVYSGILRMSSVTDKFRSIEKYLLNKEQWIEVVNDRSCLCFLPTSNSVTKGHTSLIGKRRYNIDRITGPIQEEREYIEISNLAINIDLARKGDCGGVIVSFHDRYQSKLIGFHSGGTAVRWYASILTREDLVNLEEHSFENDRWKKLIVPGSPTDLPHGSEVTFIGKYKYTTQPASSKNLSHWRYSPFSNEFEEQLEPGPLDAYDSRIKVELPTNEKGIKTLLLTPNSVMCQQLPEMEQNILDIIKVQLIDEMKAKIPTIRRTPSTREKAIELGLNGDRENIFCKGMEIEKACGLPWNELPGCSKKSDFLQQENGHVTFKNDKNGRALFNRVMKKLQDARIGERCISLSNSKLKDALIKKSAVEQGKTRVFHCIPVDKVICDAALFGNFKEAYQKAFLNLNHAIGVNPHSLAWRSIYEHLDTHPNVFDMDFSNYDKHLHSELMHTAFKIIREVIQAKAPDEWDLAREILETEAIETFVVDYDTVYKTERGNKSGEYLTTVINCICNDILSFYTWIKTTGIKSLHEFRSNVSIVTFGDDKVESVSDKYAEKYNYFTAKKIMSSIGHKITPGAKDGVERQFNTLEEAQFLKRGFKNWNGLITGPLLERSIESPFVWTQIENSEIMIWKNLIEEKLFEACLHGEEYYEKFRSKLSKCEDPYLLNAIAPMIAVPYELIIGKYLEKYHQGKIHLE